MPLRFLATLVIFVGTMFLVVRRPRQWPEAVWTCLGAGLLIALRLVSPAEAGAVVLEAADALLFLLALLILSALLERSGFFDWAAILAASRARGSVRTLYRNVFLLGALITTVLSLDTTAVILTPVVLAFVRRLELRARPFVFACAFVANVASLSLPVSNLTNLLFATTFQLSFARFGLRMLLPSLTALAINYWLFCRIFRRDLDREFALEQLPAPRSAVPHRGYFRWSVGVFGAVCVGYFLAPLIHARPYQIGFAGCAVLLVVGVVLRRLDFAMARKLQWSVFPFAMGLFVVVRAVENLGVARLAAALLARIPQQPLIVVPATALLAGIGANVVNNLPAALLARHILQAAHAPMPAVYGALIGTNIGPNVVVIGSLATMLVLARAGKDGDAPSNLDFLRVGLRVTPLVLLAASMTLALTFVL
jgi:arsenical pump membrane protein